MKIAIIGGGSVGRALGRVWGKAGHAIVFGLRNPNKDKHLDLPGERAGVSEAASAADVTVLAVPFVRVDSVAEALGPDFSRVLIDCTNPTNEDFSALDPRGHSSGAAYVKSKLPKARIVKAFNQMGADTMADAVYPEG
ncbi:MAG: NAD(P)-binding domain-containing protein, partial [Pseudomonadota bacterium]